jgi:hypothetical protein
MKNRENLLVQLQRTSSTYRRNRREERGQDDRIQEQNDTSEVVSRLDVTSHDEMPVLVF